MKKHLVVLSGAGISAESGIATFRDSNGLWENHRIEDVASPEGFRRNPELVLNFYNLRRAQAASVLPNRGHEILKELEQYFEVSIITQNVDSLHERAGSSRVLHLHGELCKARSSRVDDFVIDIGAAPINLGDAAADGSQLRPYIVWFGEAVPMFNKAIELASQADLFLVVGTSLQVYPAAGLVYYVAARVPVFVVDPHIPPMHLPNEVFNFEDTASNGLAKLRAFLLEKGYHA